MRPRATGPHFSGEPGGASLTGPRDHGVPRAGLTKGMDVTMTGPAQPRSTVVFSVPVRPN